MTTKFGGTFVSTDIVIWADGMISMITTKNYFVKNLLLSIAGAVARPREHWSSVVRSPNRFEPTFLRKFSSLSCVVS